MACKADSSNGVPVVLRVKRKRTEDPADALVVSKYKKLDPSVQESNSAVFHFVGTVHKEDGESDILDHIKKHNKDHQAQVKLNPFAKLSLSERQESCREEKMVSSKNRRFIVVSKLRRLEEDSSKSEKNEHDSGARDLMKEMVHLYDVEEEDVTTTPRPPLSTSTDQRDLTPPKDHCRTASEREHSGRDSREAEMKSVPETHGEESTITCNSTRLIREKVHQSTSAGSGDYVYDLYYTTHHGGASSDWKSLYIHDYDLELVHDILHDDPLEQAYDEEDDSNDEDNWRNDYPDEEDSYNSNSDDGHEDYRNRDVDYIGLGYALKDQDSSYWDSRYYDDSWGDHEAYSSD